LTEGDNLIGRDPASTVFLDATGVSRRHARIVIGEHAALLEDLGSKNGTTLGDRVLTGKAALHDGDRIQVGPILLVFHASASGLSTETVTGHSSRPRQMKLKTEK
jgi:pSer/pThr/pTyr-binding forkhead associated (FHA) protein